MAVFLDGEVGAGEAADRLALVVGDEHIHNRLAGVNLQRGGGGWLLLRRLERRSVLCTALRVDSGQPRRAEHERGSREGCSYNNRSAVTHSGLPFLHS